MINQFYNRGNISIKDKIFSLDYILIISVLLLGIISFFAMYSTEQGQLGYYTQNHIYRFSIFFLLFILLSLVRIETMHKVSYLFYFIVLILLICVDIFGITASGSKRWINIIAFNLQPSELMKVGLIIFLARYYNKVPVGDLNSIKYLIVPIFALFIPVALIVNQPDLGTAILIAVGGLSVVWLAGFRLKYFIYGMVFLTTLVPVLISFLKPYQKSRILTFFNPERDPLGAGYQIIQSKIAIGSGGIFGKGFLKGSQSYLDYLPEKHTDFIFTLFSEEFGFIGCLVLLFIYALIIYRILHIGLNSRNNFSRLFCYGFASIFFLYVGVNMSMVLGLLPIVGAPLPIMSYGGSSLLSMMIGLGVVMSCKIHSGDELT